jgi:hypothetical protein
LNSFGNCNDTQSTFKGRRNGACIFVFHQMTRLNLALSHQLQKDFTRQIHHPMYTQNQIRRPRPARFRSPAHNNRQPLPCRTLNARTHAGLRACMHLVRVVRRHTYICPCYILRAARTSRKNASFVTTARAESERADRTIRESRLPSPSAIPPNQQCDSDGLLACFSNLFQASSPPRHLAKRRRKETVAR